MDGVRGQPHSALSARASAVSTTRPFPSVGRLAFRNLRALAPSPPSPKNTSIPNRVVLFYAPPLVHRCSPSQGYDGVL